MLNGVSMNIRTLLLTFLSTCILSNTIPLLAMEQSLKNVADHASIRFGEELTKAGAEMTKALPKSLWTSILSIAGAVFVYKGFNQLLNTWGKTDEKLRAQHEDSTKSYTVSACKIIAGLLSLSGSYAVWNWK